LDNITSSGEAEKELILGILCRGFSFIPLLSDSHGDPWKEQRYDFGFGDDEID
jgi:hypothetical protein